MSASQFLSSVLDRALVEVQHAQVPVFTFALYHDHESGAVSVCVDTEEQSNRTVQGINRYNIKHFMKAVENNDLKGASLWQANIGRSLSLGDFALVNAARAELGDVKPDDQFYLNMVQCLVASHERVAALSPHPERVVFACSGPKAEIAYVWALPPAA